MKNLMMVLTVAAMAQVVGAADVSWTGPGGVVDWNAATWSTGMPPGATDTVTFKPNAHSADFTVTPPADFTGKIVLGGYSSATSLTSDYIPGRIRIVNSNNATFTISGSNAGGSCVIEAFPGLEQMIDPAYANVVDIPADVTFAPTASFPSGVTFTGVGTFRPATVVQLEKAHAFRGVLDLRGLANLDLGRYDSLLLGREVILGEGASFSDRYADKLVSQLSMNKASDWTLNSAFAEETPACRPTVDASGMLSMPHVSGVHNRTTAFLNRRFKADEAFVAKFKFAITANEHISGFGIVLHKGEATDVGSGTFTMQGGAIPPSCYGLVTLYYNAWGSSFNVLERIAGNRTEVGSFDGWRGYQQGPEAGLTLRNGNPIGVVVSCHNKILSISLTQDGVTRTYRQDASGAFADTRGALFGFFSHENIQETPSLNVTISDFEGWVSSSSNSPWQTDPDFAFGADNYHLYLDYRTSATSVTNSFRGADALDDQGRLRLCEGMYWFGAAVSKNVVPNNKKFRLNWTLDVGATAGGGEHTDIGFGKYSDADIRQYFGNYDIADGSGYATGSRLCLSVVDPIKFCHSWYQNLFGMTRNWRNGSQAGDYTGTYEQNSVFKKANSTNVGKMYFDGVSAYETLVVNSAEGLTHAFTLTTTPDGTRHIAVVGDGNTGWACYTLNWLRDLSLCFWNDAYVPPVSTRVVAPTAGTTDVAGLGTYAPFERIAFGDVATRVRVTGTVAFGDALTIKVPDNFLKSTREAACLVDLSAATVSGSLPTTVTLVDSTGAAIPMRGRALTVNASGIDLSGPRGLLVVVQ